MPVIADTSQEAALRLQRAAEPLNPPEDRIVVQTGWPSAAGFFVGDALFAAWEADLLLPAPALPNCRANAPCYAPLCGEDVVFEPPTLTALAPNTAAIGAPNTTVTLTGTNFVAPMTVTIDPPGAEAPVQATATVTSPTSATVVVPAAALDAAGAVSVSATTAHGTTAVQNITVA